MIAQEKSMYTWQKKKRSWQEEAPNTWGIGEFNSIEECLVDARDKHGCKAGDVLIVGRITRYIPKVNIKNMLAEVEEAAYDDVGEMAYNWKIHTDNKLEFEKLQYKINSALLEYLDSSDSEPKFYTITDIEEHTIYD